MVAERAPLQQEVWLADLNPVAGSEQAGVRPVLVISRSEFNATMRLLTITPLTTSLTMRGHPAAVFVKADETGPLADSLILTFHVRTIDRNRLKRMLFRLPEDDMARVKYALGRHFGLGES